MGTTNVVIEGEQWRDIPGFEGIYQASTHGRIQRLSQHKEKCKRRKPTVMKCSLNRAGYRKAVLSKNKKVHHFTSHSLVALAFLGPRPADFQVNHINGIKTDNRPQNLEYVTASENVKHAFRTLLRPPVLGARILSDDAVIEIRRLYAANVSRKEIFSRFTEVTPGAINNVLKGATFKHLI